MKYHKHRKGAALILVVICSLVLFIILALVIDIGRLYVAKQRAQNVADASAMAGAWMLDGTTGGTTLADQEARKIALSNNGRTENWKTHQLDGAEGITVDFPTSFARDDGTSVTVSPGEAIRVRCQCHVEYGFGKVIGLDNGKSGAQAIVMRTGASSLKSPFAPWVVADTTIWDTSVDPPTPKLSPESDPTVLKITNPGANEAFIGPGNFLCVAYEGDHGGDDYRDRIAGVATPITIDVGGAIQLSTEPGNMIGPTNQGVLDRLSQDTVFPSPGTDSTAFSEFMRIQQETGTYPDTPRIVIVPIVEDPGGSLSGRSDLTVVGYAGFFIESFDKKDGTVTGRFLSATTSGDVFRWDLGIDSTQTNLMYVIKIVS